MNVQSYADIPMSNDFLYSISFQGTHLVQRCGVPNRIGTALYSRGRSKSRAIFVFKIGLSNVLEDTLSAQCSGRHLSQGEIAKWNSTYRWVPGSMATSGYGHGQYV